MSEDKYAFTNLLLEALSCGYEGARELAAYCTEHGIPKTTREIRAKLCRLHAQGRVIRAGSRSGSGGLETLYRLAGMPSAERVMTQFEQDYAELIRRLKAQPHILGTDLFDGLNWDPSRKQVVIYRLWLDGQIEIGTPTPTVVGWITYSPESASSRMLKIMRAVA